MNKDTTVQNLVGNVTPEQLKYVDCFISPRLGLFIPAVGPCMYAISKDHMHPAYSFILSYDDNCALSVGNKTIASIPGTISAMSPDIPHHEVLTGNFARYIAIMIDKEYFESELSSYPIQADQTFKGEIFFPKNDIKPFLNEFMAEYENHLPCHDKLLEACALRITHAIIRCVHDFKHTMYESTQRMSIDKVIEFIHSHYDRKIDIHTMADVACLSPSHFSRLFRISTGKSPMTFLLDTRLDKSKKLLLAGDFTISETAYKSGFSSSSHFSNLFFRKLGQTPTEYKKTMQ
jgi:AraC family transcriptional regulator